MSLPPEALAEACRQADEAPAPSDRLKSDLRDLLRPLPEPLPTAERKAS